MAVVYTGEGGPEIVTAPAFDADLPIIAQFAGPALVELRDRSPDAIARRRGEMDRQRARLRRSLAARRSFRRDFRSVLNGAALAVSRSERERIGALPFVEAVFDDREVRALLSDSVPLIGADEVESTLGATGAGTTIAIVDTGVDYTHPDLGSGFGPGFKVVGGFDFVDDDGDPFDDNGHGSHVAGIAAANGVVRGVAPDASLLAVKVLGSRGSGFSSDAIAGIEFAVDPDGDPLTDDAADVINLSLGAPGNPDDPLSQAVDNAVLDGVVVVAAAGNRSAYFTIGSPGQARRALTVGATTKADSRATFSSRGPSETILEIKPDVMAPGVSITSTVPSGSCSLCDPTGYRSLSGTSMATPHVSGAAAVLLGLNPAWDPDTVKAALMNHGVDTGEDVFSQGAGRIDVLASATGEALASGASLSFGVDDGSEPSFAASQQVDITNRASTTQTFNLSLQGLSLAGIASSVSPATLTLAPDESAAALVEITVDNAILPDRTEEPFHYEGDVLVQSASPAIRLPMAFIKSSVLELQFDEAPQFTVVHDRSGLSRFLLGGTTSSVWLLPAGTYDVRVTYSPTAELREVFREDVALAGTTSLFISASEATNRLSLTFPVSVTPSFRNTAAYEIFHKATRFLGAQIRVGGTPPDLVFSDVSAAYEFHWQARVQELSAPGYSAVFTFEDGISASHDLSPSLDEFVPAVFDLSSVEDVAETFVRTQVCGWRGNGARFCTGLAVERDPPVSPTTAQSEFLMLRSKPLGYGYAKKEAWSYLGDPFQFGLGGERPFVDGGLVGAPDADSVVQLHQFFSRPDPLTPLFSVAPGEAIPLGLGPVHWSASFRNSGSLIELSFGTSPFALSPYDGQIGDARWTSPATYELFQGGALIGSGDLSTTIPVTPGTYTLRVLTDDYPIGEFRGNAITEATFDTTLADPNPPSLRSLQITADGFPTDVLRRRGANELVVEAEDAVCLDSVAAWIDEGLGLVPIGLTRVGDQQVASLPFSDAATEVTLRVLASDCSGNELQLDLLPGFLRDTSAIDIKPGNDPNSINLARSTIIPVGILGSESFDVLAVDRSSLCFGADPPDAGASDCTKSHLREHSAEDLDGDGDMDMVVHFDTAETGITFGDTEACVTGQLLDGTPFEGCDAIRTLPPSCGLGFELALLFPGLMWLYQRRQRTA